MENTVALVCDAELLFQNGSHGRARSLLVLAQEELARASALYDTAEHTWTTGEGSVELSPTHLSVSKMHRAKIEAGDQYGSRLGPFWGDYDNIPEPRDAGDIDKLKQVGFYVDRSPGVGGRFGSPLDVDPGPVAQMLLSTAQIAEMALITDHSRMKYHSDLPYDSTMDLQNALLPISHPQEYADFIEAVGTATLNADLGDATE